MPDAGTDLLIVTVAAPTNAIGTGRRSSWSTAGIERQVNIHGGGQQRSNSRRFPSTSGTTCATTRSSTFGCDQHADER